MSQQTYWEQQKAYYDMLRDTPTEVLMERYFEHMRTHCNTCDTKLTEDGKCVNRKWWQLFHTVTPDATWTLFV